MEEDCKNDDRHVPSCPECGCINLIFDHQMGETVCSKCGRIVQEQRLYRGPDWRGFTKQEREAKTRGGKPTSYFKYDRGLGSHIGKEDKDAHGQKLTASTKGLMQRLKKTAYFEKMKQYSMENLTKAMKTLNRLSDKTHLSFPVRETAAVIYRRALDKDLIRGRSIEGITAASVYAACRKTGTARTLGEIAEASFVDEKAFNHYYEMLKKELELGVPLGDSLNFVGKIGEETGISGETQGLACQILHETGKLRGITEKDSLGYAAAALYIACQRNREEKTQKEIAEAAGVSTDTVRNKRKTLEKS
ncbi:MAG: transcription initiation factor IIB [Thermoproteota archaeon]